MLCRQPDSDGMDPSSEYCANKQQGLKLPQETTCLFCSEIENKLPNKQINKQINKQTNKPRNGSKITTEREDP